jgi:phosphate starvation-inducible protein PhoH and related proteins
MLENKDKRKLKTTPRLNVKLTDEQKEVARLFHEFDVNFIIGDFGSGKTLTAVYLAISSYREKSFNKIWITRPMLKTKLAALPGSIDEKMQPYVFPIYQNIGECQAEASTEKMIKEGVLKIMPIEVAKGVTFMDSCVIVDEFQDMDYQDFRTILTRLGKDSKIIFCGSPQQVDKTMERTSCLKEVMKLKDSGIVGFTELKANHRNPILSEIIDYLEGKQ